MLHEGLNTKYAADRFEALTLATRENGSVSVSNGKILRSPECIRIPEARWRGVKHGAGHVIYC